MTIWNPMSSSQQAIKRKQGKENKYLRLHVQMYELVHTHTHSLTHTHTHSITHTHTHTYTYTYTLFSYISHTLAQINFCTFPFILSSKSLKIAPNFHLYMCATLSRTSYRTYVRMILRGIESFGVHLCYEVSINRSTIIRLLVTFLFNLCFRYFVWSGWRKFLRKKQGDIKFRFEWFHGWLCRQRWKQILW